MEEPPYSPALRRVVPSWVLLTAAGLAGAVIVGLVPNSSGYLIVFVTIYALPRHPPESRRFPRRMT